MRPTNSRPSTPPPSSFRSFDGPDGQIEKHFGFLAPAVTKAKNAGLAPIKLVDIKIGSRRWRCHIWFEGKRGTPNNYTVVSMTAISYPGMWPALEYLKTAQEALGFKDSSVVNWFKPCDNSVAIWPVIMD